MSNEITTKKQPTMSVILASNSIAELGKSLCLSEKQLMKARSSALALSSDPKLSKCDPYSLVKYCFEIARYNFSRDDCAYPVPYGNKVQAQIGYKGFRELAMESQKYDEISCSEVYSCDKVIRDRETGQLKVEFNEDYLATATSTLIGFFAYARTKEGRISNSLFWTKEQCEKHGKRYSKTYNSVWGDKEFGFVKMAKKTVIKQLCQELDQTPQLQEAIKQDQIVFGGNGENDKYLDNPLTDSYEVKYVDSSEVKEVVEENITNSKKVENPFDKKDTSKLGENPPHEVKQEKPIMEEKEPDTIDYDTSNVDVEESVNANADTSTLRDITDFLKYE